jgi:hypothetical protein
MLPILRAYLDESADETRSSIYCVGALLCNEQMADEMQNRWSEILADEGMNISMPLTANR